MFRRVPVTIWLVQAVFVAGCAWRTPPATNRAALDVSTRPELHWPERRTSDLDAIAAASPDIIGISFPVEAETHGSARDPIPYYRVVRAEAHGVGVIRMVQPVDTSGVDERDEPPSLQFLAYPPDSGPVDDLPGLTVLHADEPPESILQRIHIDVHQDASTAPAGIAVFVRSSGGYEYEAGLIETFLERGWRVLELGMPIGWFSEARLREKVGLPGHDEQEALTEQQWMTVAKRAALLTDDQLAQRAFAVEAAVEAMWNIEPDLRDRPVVAIGASSGALVTPTIMARTPARFDAAVLICGGANLLSIAWRSPILSDRYTTDHLDHDARARIEAHFLNHAKLDPWHTAPWLTSIPVLQLHGRFDAVVPAESGNLLYDRLGEPERWSYFGGHGLVFWMLPHEAQSIADWVEQHAVE